jgi:hypothetical protein
MLPVRATMAIAAISALSSSLAIAQSLQSLPPNTLDCNNFTKNAYGSWTGHKDQKPFDIGNARGNTAVGLISRGTHRIGGIDLYDLLEAKCKSEKR